MLASEASELTVFQRTPNLIVPANNDALESDKVRDVVAGFEERRRRIRSRRRLCATRWVIGRLEVDGLERERELEAR